MLNYDVLVGIGSDGLPSKETGLAEDWSLSPDQKTWTFKIRPGVKWQDGQPLHGGRRGLDLQHHHQGRPEPRPST